MCAIDYIPVGWKVEPSPRVKTWPSSNPKTGPLQNGGGKEMHGMGPGYKSAAESKPITKIKSK